MGKIRVGMVFGGRSGEHEVSVRSATSIFKALDKNKYDVELLGVDKAGGWHRMDQKWLPVGTEMKSLPSGDKSLVVQEEKVDVFFPIVHGLLGKMEHCKDCLSYWMWRMWGRECWGRLSGWIRMCRKGCFGMPGFRLLTLKF